MIRMTTRTSTSMNPSLAAALGLEEEMLLPSAGSAESSKEWASGPPRLLRQRAKLPNRQRDPSHIRRLLPRQRAHERLQPPAVLQMRGQVI